FWSNQGDIKLQIAGLSTGYDQTVVRHDAERGKFSVLYYRDGQIIAADCANAPLDFMAVKQALSKGKNIDADAAANGSTMLKSLIAKSAACPRTHLVQNALTTISAPHQHPAAFAEQCPQRPLPSDGPIDSSPIDT